MFVIYSSSNLSNRCLKLVEGQNCNSPTSFVPLSSPLTSSTPTPALCSTCESVESYFVVVPHWWATDHKYLPHLQADSFPSQVLSQPIFAPTDIAIASPTYFGVQPDSSG